MVARRRRDNILVGVLAVLAILGGGHAVADFFSGPPPGPSENSTLGIVGNAQLVGSFAETFVTSYLGATSGQQERIADFVGGAQQLTLPSSPRQVSDPQVVFATRTDGNSAVEVWAVTVSVRIAKSGTMIPASSAAGTSTAAPPGAGTTTTAAPIAADLRQYYRVGIDVVGGRPRALAPPAQVPPPERGSDLLLAYSATCQTDTPLAQVATGFMQALLTGSADIARYTTPDSGITALRPAPFTTVDSVTVGADDSHCGASGDSARVLVSVNVKGDAGGVPTLAYPLAMVRAAGSWQVRAIESVPALRYPMTVVTGQNSRNAVATTTAPVTSTTTAAAAQIPAPTQH
ncbi:conjugal transfer protein [Nocardia stercoris]|uniref:Conjugal transfer protein n=1 Tax=Nocardia stercoris TaxID=2483361 RepID=A0A3M2LAT0_9NOCA|nr:conjugal transfer protein [Nocardia stercoris]RMI33045.1 conjugal transfer protein [Nocardia stercoris]